MPGEIEALDSGQKYLQIFQQINRDPYSDQTWEMVLNTARSEELTAVAQRGFWGKLPLEEMATVAQRLKAAPDTEERYQVLAERSTTGDLWYDIVLGRVNDKTLGAISQEIGIWRNFMGRTVGYRVWERGLDLGTGTGNSLRELQKCTKKAVGVDSLDFLLKTNKRDGSSLVIANALHLPFANESFDVAQSNGLTFYLPKDELRKFVAEVSRVLEPGGSYFQAYPMPPDQTGIVEIEKEYLTNGKALLACLMDRLITQPHAEKKGEPSEFSLLSKAFEGKGFLRKVFTHKREGVVVLEFKKRFPKEIEHLKHAYLSGDDYESETTAFDVLYGGGYDLASLKNLKPEYFLPEQIIIKNLHYFTKLAAEQEIIDSINSNPILYSRVFIYPLIDLITNEKWSSETQTAAITTISTIIQNRVSRHPTDTTFARQLEVLRKKLENTPRAATVVSQIDTILQGK